MSPINVYIISAIEKIISVAINFFLKPEPDKNNNVEEDEEECLMCGS